MEEETYFSSRLSAALTRPVPVRIPYLDKDSKPVSQGMRVDKSSKVEMRENRRYSRIGRCGGAGEVDHDFDGVEGVPPFLAIGEGGEDCNECPRDGSDRARNRPRTTKRTKRKKR
jgi:hypothetical protein